MRNPDLNRCPPDLVETIEMLERERPVATPLELDQMKTRIMARRQSTRRSGAKGSLLKTRFAITMMLVLGILLSCTGAGLAVSGSSSSGSASQVQYPPPKETENNGNVLGNEEQPAAQGTQEADQVAATTSSGSLPFTGLAAIPILAVGVGLFGTGIVVRRSAKREQA